jgi:hypothetical protein
MTNLTDARDKLTALLAIQPSAQRRSTLAPWRVSCEPFWIC